MDPDRPAADLEAVEDHVVAVALDLARIGQEQPDIRVARAGERMMRCDPLLELLAVLEKRRVDDPQEFPDSPPSVLGDVAQLLAEVYPKIGHHRVCLRLPAQVKKDPNTPLWP